ncbi:hypothetical protein ACIRS1_35155 [Kitasatospora sp. NPDC101176]|uniref:hypothetical protein n=1 Tax=Kitasatospora sp. NPDC101176 TaxID=3364099 RepID=UPI0037F2453D
MELSPRARLRAGDERALGELYDANAQAVYGYALRSPGDWAAAEDVVSLTLAVPSGRDGGAAPAAPMQQLVSADRSKSVVGMPVTPKLSSQLAFGDVQRIFMNVTAPPAVAGALMTAAANLPGTAVVADEADAAGRHGVAVVGTNGTQRVSLVFDPVTGAFLGVREVLLTDLPAGGPGDLPPTGNPGPGAGNGTGYTFATAVLESGVVDRAGDRPKG